MSRIRYLKPEFFEDEDIASLKVEERLFYAGLWCHADKAGRLEDRPKRLKAVIFPYDNFDPEKILTRLCKNKASGRPFIQRYSVNGEKYIQILQWAKHQHPHNTEKESIIPPAPPPNYKDKDKDKDKDKGIVTTETLDNAEITVKEPLKNNNDTVKYGRFVNVLLTIEEFKKVTVQEIEALSEYLASKGKKYKNHYATILSWRRKNEQQSRTDRPNNPALPGTKSTKYADIGTTININK